MTGTHPPAISTFCCSLDRDKLGRLATFLQAGFYQETREGETLAAFLSALPGFTDAYIAGRLQTIFLDGDAVDDLSRCLAGNATLALSAAMPGLAGAIFRRNSPHAALRKAAAAAGAVSSGRPIRVLVKLFNAIALERGPELLAHGVVVDAARLLEFLRLRPSILAAMTGARTNNATAAESIPDILAHHRQITLVVNCVGNEIRTS